MLWFIAALLLVAQTASASPAWISPYLVGAQPLPLEAHSFFFKVAFGEDGDVILADYGSSQYQFTRVSAAGQLRWTVNFGGNTFIDGYQVNALLATSDGATFVAFGGPYDGYMVRIGIDGDVAWSARVPAQWLVAANDSVLIGAGCKGAYGDPQTAMVTAIDRANGHTLWQKVFPGQGCGLQGLVPGSDSTFYVLSSSTLTKLDDSGQTVWTAVASADRLVGADATHVYVLGSYAVQAFGANDGAHAWDAQLGRYATSAVLPDALAGPAVLLDDNSLHRFDLDGAPLWTASLASGQSLVATNGGIYSIGASVTSIGPSNGATLWTAPLPSGPQGLGFFALAVGPVGGGTLLGVLSANASGAPGLLQPINSVTGELNAPIDPPQVSHGVQGFNTIFDDTRIINGAIALAPNSAQISVRRLDATSGALIWKATEPPQLLEGIPFVPDWISLAMNTDTVAAAAGEEYWGGDYISGSGFAWAAAYDAATGVKRWSTTFYELFQRYTSVGDPGFLSNGDMILAFGAPVVSFPGVYPEINQTKLSVLRLAASDGHLVWRRDAVYGDAAFNAPSGSPPFIVADDDVIVAGAFETIPTPSGLVRLSGADGHTMWSSSVLSLYGPYALFPHDDGTVTALAYDGWARVDENTGSAQWTSAATPDCPLSDLCNYYGTTSLANGDLLSLIEHRYAFATVIRRRGDGSGIENFWQLEPETPLMRVDATGLSVDANGDPWITLNRSFKGSSAGIEILARFDPTNGSVSGQQILGNSYGDILTPVLSAFPVAAPKNNRLLVDSHFVQQPMPGTYGSAVLDTTVTAEGDLSVGVEAETPVVTPGALLTFHLHASYTGNQPVDGVSLLGLLPWNSGLDDVACSGTGVSNCVTDIRSGNLRATFDVAANAQVEISGVVKVIPWPNDTPMLRVMARGPVGLRESNTLNNFSTMQLTQSLFRDGFE